MSDAALAPAPIGLPQARPEAAPGLSRANRRRFGGAARTVAILLVLLVFIGPIVWIVLTAFKEPRDVYALRLFFEPTLANPPGGLRAALPARRPHLEQRRGHSRHPGALAADRDGRPPTHSPASGCPGAKAWSLGMLATQFIPPVIVIIPLFVAFRTAGLLDTRIALIIANMSFVVPTRSG
jgi:multiple sugar transport system permease protein